MSTATAAVTPINAPTAAAPKQTKAEQVQALLARYLELSDKELETLAKLTKEVKTDIAKRGDELKKLKASITELSPALSELFDTDELKALVMAGKYEVADLFTEGAITALSGKGTKKNKAASNATPSTKPPRASASRDVLLTGSLGTGKAFEYRGGRVWEDAQSNLVVDIAAGKKLTPWAAATFPAVLIAHGQTEADLLKLATPAGKTYFATAEGKTELAKIVEFAVAAKKAKPKA